MRVIAGKARGKKLESLEGMDVRPTLDKVKGAIFNIIQFEIAGKRVLDLFGGSGSLGIESVSRGAESAVIVDLSKNAAEVIKRNVSGCKMGENITVCNENYYEFVNKYKGEKFDIIFLDPPYHKNLIDEAISAILCCQIIDKCGIIICERDKNDVLKDKYGDFVLQKEYFYGKSIVSIYKYGSSE